MITRGKLAKKSDLKIPRNFQPKLFLLPLLLIAVALATFFILRLLNK